MLLQRLLAVTAPFQSLIDRISPTHSFINRQSVAILAADGRLQEAAWLARHLHAFNQGCDWADTDWKNLGHMYDPETGRGFRGWPSAADLFQEYWDQAVRRFLAGESHEAFFYLGAAAHLVQDMCVPHHTAAVLLGGHKRFEAYAQTHRHWFAAPGAGFYHLASSPLDWVMENAIYTRTFYSDCLDSSLPPARLHEAVADLLPRAQRSTAGFVTQFLASVNACARPDRRRIGRAA